MDNAIFIKAAQLICSLSLLVVLHELGHFIPAKLFKCRVEKFYLFFDAGFSLFKKKIGETVYGIGWLPLGGYVKISGMIDESMDTEQLNQEPQPWEFRSKPAWQRLIIMAGGVFVNVILAFIIYAAMSFYWGETNIKPQQLKYGFAVNELAQKLGLESGDKILAIDGKEIKNIDNIRFDLILGKEAVVERNGISKTIVLQKSEVVEVIADDSIKLIIEPRVLAKINALAPNRNGEKAGLQAGDYLIGLNGNVAKFNDEYLLEIQKYKNQEITLDVLRNKEQKSISVQVDSLGKIGVNFASIIDFKDEFGIQKTEYSFLEAIPRGVTRTGDTFEKYIKQFKILADSELRPLMKGFGSFLSMGNLFPPTWNWYAFWSITAFLSVMLAFLNILPIPALDGGHIVFVLIEMITGKKPSQKTLEIAQTIGFFLLLALMVLAIGNDIRKFFF